ncbi:MAG: hypothetical protein ABSA75_13450 [Candidatus Bathyarchaeia archaeon]|jgi:hypothetical protein
MSEEKIVKVAKDLLDLLENSLEILSSPALIEAMVFLNATGITNQLNINKNGAGFNGFAVNTSAPLEMVFTWGSEGRTITIHNP